MAEETTIPKSNKEIEIIKQELKRYAKKYREKFEALNTWGPLKSFISFFYPWAPPELNTTENFLERQVYALAQAVYEAYANCKDPNKHDSYKARAEFLNNIGDKDFTAGLLSQYQALLGEEGIPSVYTRNFRNRLEVLKGLLTPEKLQSLEQFDQQLKDNELAEFRAYANQLSDSLKNNKDIFPDNIQYQQLYLLAEAAYEVFVEIKKNSKNFPPFEGPKVQLKSFLKDIVENANFAAGILKQYKMFIEDSRVSSKTVRNFATRIEKLKEQYGINFEIRINSEYLPFTQLNQALVAKELVENLQYIKNRHKMAGFRRRFDADINHYVKHLYPLLSLIVQLEQQIDSKITRDDVVEKYIQALKKQNNADPLEILAEKLGKDYAHFCASENIKFSSGSNVDIENFRYYAYAAAEGLGFNVRNALPEKLKNEQNETINTKESLEAKQFKELQSRSKEFKDPIKNISKALLKANPTTDNGRLSFISLLDQFCSNNVIKKKIDQNAVNFENLTDDDASNAPEAAFENKKNASGLTFESKEELIKRFGDTYSGLIDDLKKGELTVQQVEAYRNAVFQFINYRGSSLGRHITGITERELLETTFKDNDKQLTEQRALELIRNSALFFQDHPVISKIRMLFATITNYGPVKNVSRILFYPLILAFKILTFIPRILIIKPLVRLAKNSSWLNTLASKHPQFTFKSWRNSDSVINYRFHKVLRKLPKSEIKEFLAEISKPNTSLATILQTFNKVDEEPQLTREQRHAFRLRVSKFIKTLSTHAQIDILELTKFDGSSSNIIHKTAFETAHKTFSAFYKIYRRSDTHILYRMQKWLYQFSFRSSGGFRMGDKDIFRFMVLLNQLNLHKQAQGLTVWFIQRAKNLEDGPNKETKLLQEFLDMAYYMVDGLIQGEAPVIVDDSIIKKLKKHLSRFAERNGFEKQIINVKKYALEVQNDNDLADVLSNREGTSKYAYIKNKERLNFSSQKKKERRVRKKSYRDTSYKSGEWVAIFEGVVAAAFGITLLSFLPFTWAIVAGLAIGYSGYKLNAILYTTDAYATLKALFVDGFSWNKFFKLIFLDENGREVSLVKKSFIFVGAVLSLTGGVIFGVYAFTSVMLFLKGVAFLALMATAIGFPPATFVLAIAFFAFAANVLMNGAVYFTIISDFIKNDRLLQAVRFFKRNLWDVFKYKNEAGEIISFKEYKKNLPWYRKFIFHPLDAFFRALATLAIAAAAVVIATIFTFLTLGLGYNKALKALTYIPLVSNWVVDSAKTVAWVLAYAAATGVGFFYDRGFFRTFLGFGRDVVMKFITMIERIFDKLKFFREDVPNWWRDFQDNPIGSAEKAEGTQELFTSIWKLCANAGGYGYGAVAVPQPILVVVAKFMCVLGYVGYMKFTSIMASFFLNFEAQRRKAAQPGYEKNSKYKVDSLEMKNFLEEKGIESSSVPGPSSRSRSSSEASENSIISEGSSSNTISEDSQVSPSSSTFITGRLNENKHQLFFEQLGSLKFSNTSNVQEGRFGNLIHDYENIETITEKWSCTARDEQGKLSFESKKDANGNVIKDKRGNEIKVCKKVSYFDSDKYGTQVRQFKSKVDNLHKLAVPEEEEPQSAPTSKNV